MPLLSSMLLSPNLAPTWRTTPFVACTAASSSGMEPVEVVEAQLKHFQRADSQGLQDAHALMSPAYHVRADAVERFSTWFDSPFYEALNGCTDWRLRGALTTREEAAETKLPDGRTFLGSQSVEQVIKVDVTPGRAKWQSSGATGARVGQALPTTSYLWTVSLQPEGGWTVDRIEPEEALRVPDFQQ